MRWKVTAWVRTCGAAALFAWACTRPPALIPPTVAPPVPKVLPTICERIVAIEVSKSARRLRAHCEGGDVVELPVALGRASDGPKRGEGDARTPEGHYRISGPPRPSRFHSFLPIDYPSLADAEAALADGRLSEADYLRIADAHERGEPPPSDTALGGQLGFHGEGARWRGESRYLDWTYGCIALEDRDVDYIAARSAVGTPVVIEP